MRFYADNMLSGTIMRIGRGRVGATASILIGNAQIDARMPAEAVDRLGLAAGMEVTAMFDAARVQFVGDRGRVTHISEVNKLAGVVNRIEKQPERTRVTLALSNGVEVVGDVEPTTLESLGLREGWPAVAIIKPEDVFVGVE